MGSDGDTRITKVRPIPVTRGSSGACYFVQIYPTGPDLGRRFELGEEMVTVGRGADNSIVLDIDSVSRRHCQVVAAQGERILHDLGSTNGTYVNDHPIDKHTLRNGDLVKVGSTIFKFLSGSNIESEYHEEIYRMTIIDGLTEIYNKRSMLEFLEREAARCRRYARPLALVMFDIDHFKKINDTHGHLTGDYVLKELAKAVKGRIRREEHFARYGGEEFAITLPETDKKAATQFAEAIRGLVEKHHFEFEGHPISATISLGVGMLSDELTDVQQLIKVADENLYAAKRGGRNRAVA
jgi:diguanylate cyclase (GGDEF)-like protein